MNLTNNRKFIVVGVILGVVLIFLVIITSLLGLKTKSSSQEQTAVPTPFLRTRGSFVPEQTASTSPDLTSIPQLREDLTPQQEERLKQETEAIQPLPPDRADLLDKAIASLPIETDDFAISYS